MPSKKLSQIRAMIMVAVMNLERVEAELAANAKKKADKKPPPLHLKLIKGGKS